MTQGTFRSATGIAGVYSNVVFTLASDFDSPGSIAAGDILLAVVTGGVLGNVDTIPIVAPSGFTQISATGSATAALNGAAFWKLITASEPSEYKFRVPIAPGTSSAVEAAVHCVVYRNVHNTTPIDAVGSWLSDNSSAASVVCPAVTTVTANTMVVGFVKCSDDVSMTKPASMTQRTNEAYNVGTDFAMASGDEAVAATGSTGTRTFTTAASKTGRIGVLVALKPAGGTAIAIVTQGEGPSIALTGAGRFAVAKPVGAAENDVLILVISNSANADIDLATDPPSGFTLVTEANVGTDPRVAVYRKTAGPSEPDFYEYGPATSLRLSAAMLAYEFGGDPPDADPIDVVGSWSNAVTGSSTSITASGVTVTQADCVLIAVFRGHAAGTLVPTAYTASLVARATINGAAQQMVALADEPIGAGATGNKTATVALGNSTDRRSVLFALKPSPVPPIEISVPQSVNVQAEEARPVPQGVNVQAVGTRSVPQAVNVSEPSGAISRTVPQAANVGEAEARTVPQAVNLQTAEERSAPQSVNVQDTGARTVPQAANVGELRDPRAVPQAVNIADALRRVVAQGVNIQDVAARLVGQAVNVGAGFVRAVAQAVNVFVYGRPDWILEIDRDGDSFFEDGDDVLPDTRANPAPSFRAGMDGERIITPPVAGSAGFKLDNRDGQSEAATGIVKGRLVRLREDGSFDGIEREFWRGIIDRATRERGDFDSRMVVQALGPLSLINGRSVNISTRVLVDARTDEALNELLDAGGYPRNAGSLITTWGTLAGVDTTEEALEDYTPGFSSGWDLGADVSTGDSFPNLAPGEPALDVDFPETAQDTAIDDSGALSLGFDGATTRADAGGAGVADIFEWGGAIFAELVAYSDGGGNNGVIVNRNASGTIFEWTVSDESAGAMRLQFTHNALSGSDGVWRTSDRVIEVNTRYAAFVYMRGQAASDNPTMFLVNIDTGEYARLDVGSGLTETVTPSAAPDDNFGGTFYVGNNSAFSKGWDGRLDAIRVLRNIGMTADDFEPYAKQALARAVTAARVFDEGISKFGYWWAGDLTNAVDVFSEMLTIYNSEGPSAQLYEDRRGRLVFRNRHALVNDERSNTVQYAISDSAQPSHSAGEYDDGLDSIAEYAEVTINRRAEADAGEVVWTAPASFLVAAGSPVTVRVMLDEPVIDAILPEDGVDFASSGLSGGILDVVMLRDSGAVLYIKFEITFGFTCMINDLQLRATRIPVISEEAITTTGVDPVAALNLVPFSRPLHPELKRGDAQAVVDTIPIWYGQGAPSIRDLVILGDEPTKIAAQFGIETGDRISVTDAALGLVAAEFIVMNAEYTLDASGRLLVTRYYAELARDVVYGRWDISEWQDTGYWGF